MGIVGGGPVGVELAGEIVEQHKNKNIQQRVEVDEEKIEADLVISCIGLPPHKESIRNLVTAEQIDEEGRIKVNDFLQVSDHQNIFAVGDCCNTQEHKMAAFAGAHGETVARNIIKEVMGCPPTPYKRPFVGMLVPFGSSAGAGMFNGFHIPSFIGSRLKYGGLFTDKYWSTVGLQIPQ